MESKVKDSKRGKNVYKNKKHKNYPSFLKFKKIRIKKNYKINFRLKETNMVPNLKSIKYLF